LTATTVIFHLIRFKNVTIAFLTPKTIWVFQPTYQCPNFNSDITFDNKKTVLIHKNLIEMFLRCTIYDIWINSSCRFNVNGTFWYVVCEHVHNLEEGGSCLTVFCFRIETLPTITKCERLIALAFQFSVLIDSLTSLISV
jgi:hypothetical protein